MELKKYSGRINYSICSTVMEEQELEITEEVNLTDVSKDLDDFIASLDDDIYLEKDSGNYSNLNDNDSIENEEPMELNFESDEEEIFEPEDEEYIFEPEDEEDIFEPEEVNVNDSLFENNDSDGDDDVNYFDDIFGKSEVEIDPFDISHLNESNLDEENETIETFDISNLNESNLDEGNETVETSEEKLNEEDIDYHRDDIIDLGDITSKSLGVNKL